MSRELQAEIDMMSEEELLESMGKIRMSDLTYWGIRKENNTYLARITSKGMLEERYKTFYKENPEAAKDYNQLEDIEILKNLEYIYFN